MRRNYFSLLGPRRNVRNLGDVKDFITERAFHDDRLLNVVQLLERAELENFLAQNGDYIPFQNADGTFYRDTRQPFLVADAASVTITTAVCTPAATTNFAFLPANYFWAGKTVKHTQFARMTTGATPGNWTWSFGLSNADNTRLTSSAAIAAKASQTNLMIKAEGYATCRTVGTSGTAMVCGLVSPNLNLLNATTMYTGIIPDSAAATVTFDSTATQGLTFQVARSGSTTETILTHLLYLEAMN